MHNEDRSQIKFNIPAKVFISYSHQDEELKDKLLSHLSPLRESNLITEWHDRLLEPGCNLNLNIDENLADSDIILLLISPDYITSFACYKDELPKALEKWKNGTAKILPIILRPTDWTILPIGKHLALPTDGKAVTNHKNYDNAFLNIARGIRKIIEQQEKEECKIFKETFGEKERKNVEITLASSFKQFIQDNKKFIHESSYFLMYFIDVDGLTGINRRYSKETGDGVLKEIEYILNLWAKEQLFPTMYFKIFGDQYVLYTVYRGSFSVDNVKNTAMQLKQKIKRSFLWKRIDENFYVTISLGIVYYQFQKNDLVAISILKDDNLEKDFFINKYFIRKILKKAIETCENAKAKWGNNSMDTFSLSPYQISCHTIPIPEMMIIDEIGLWYKGISDQK